MAKSRVRLDSYKSWIVSWLFWIKSLMDLRIGRTRMLRRTVKKRRKRMGFKGYWNNIVMSFTNRWSRRLVGLNSRMCRVRRVLIRRYYRCRVWLLNILQRVIGIVEVKVEVNIVRVKLKLIVVIGRWIVERTIISRSIRIVVMIVGLTNSWMRRRVRKR